MCPNQCNAYFATCTFQGKARNVQRALCFVQHAVCTEQCAEISVQYEMCSVQFAMCSVQCAVLSVQLSHTTPVAVPTICCGCFQIQLHIDPPRCRCCYCSPYTLPQYTIHMYTLVYKYFFLDVFEPLPLESIAWRIRRIPLRGATLKFTSTPRIQGKCCGRGPMFNFQTTLLSVCAHTKYKSTKNIKTALMW